MISYWIIFVLPMLAVFSSVKGSKEAKWFAYTSFGVAMVLLIGTRYKVGGDWYTYLHHYDLAVNATFWVVLKTSDIGYAFLNWLMVQLNFGIYGVNLVCGAIFMAGLIAFSERTPNPWLAILVAVPYLIVVVAMGYTRQAVAIGFEFFALNALARRENFKFYLYVIFAALFHKTAVLLALLGIFSGAHRFSYWRLLLGIFIVYFAVNAFIVDYYETLLLNYVDAQMQSSGAMIRVLMNVLPATLLLLFYRKWRRQVGIESPWLLFALASLACIPLLMVASTAVDRMALYLAPLQLYVWSHLSLVIRASWLRYAVVLYSAAVLFVWLNFATHARFWLPYQSVISQ